VDSKEKAIVSIANTGLGNVRASVALISFWRPELSPKSSQSTLPSTSSTESEGRDKTQREKFEEAARDLECDEDEARWDERLRKVAGQKPVEDKPVRP
jgi:hypothetical protein